MWPSVARLVEERQLGTAYGVMTAIQNLGLFAFPIFAGTITDSINGDTVWQLIASATVAIPFLPEFFISGNLGSFILTFADTQGLSPLALDYTETILMFAGLGFVGFLLAYLLKREDARTGNNSLELPEME